MVHILAQIFEGTCGPLIDPIFLFQTCFWTLFDKRNLLLPIFFGGVPYNIYIYIYSVRPLSTPCFLRQNFLIALPSTSETTMTPEMITRNRCVCNPKIKMNVCNWHMHIKYLTEAPELHKIIPAKEPCVIDVLCNWELLPK